MWFVTMYDFFVWPKKFEVFSTMFSRHFLSWKFMYMFFHNLNDFSNVCSPIPQNNIKIGNIHWICVFLWEDRKPKYCQNSTMSLYRQRVTNIFATALNEKFTLLNLKCNVNSIRWHVNKNGNTILTYKPCLKFTNNL